MPYSAKFLAIFSYFAPEKNPFEKIFELTYYVVIFRSCVS
jgi:hypothetical protein